MYTKTHTQIYSHNPPHIYTDKADTHTQRYTHPHMYMKAGTQIHAHAHKCTLNTEIHKPPTYIDETDMDSQTDTFIYTYTHREAHRHTHPCTFLEGDRHKQSHAHLVDMACGQQCRVCVRGRGRPAH